jgi:hypothetical protein
MFHRPVAAPVQSSGNKSCKGFSSHLLPLALKGSGHSPAFLPSALYFSTTKDPACGKSTCRAYF